MAHFKGKLTTGQGYFCIIKKYTDESTGDEYALKELKKEKYTNQEYRYRLLREIKLLGDLQGCENVVRLVSYGNDEHSEKLWYIMPLAQSNLYDFIRKNSSKLTISNKFEIAGQVINAIKYAHERNILHRDISPNNVLIFIKANKIIVNVTDFGLGKDTASLSYYTGSSVSGYGQILYVAPEQRAKLKDSTVKSDIYSLGKLLILFLLIKTQTTSDHLSYQLW